MYAKSTRWWIALASTAVKGIDYKIYTNVTFFKNTHSSENFLFLDSSLTQVPMLERHLTESIRAPEQIADDDADDSDTLAGN